MGIFQGAVEMCRIFLESGFRVPRDLICLNPRRAMPAPFFFLTLRHSNSAMLFSIFELELEKSL